MTTLLNVRRYGMCVCSLTAERDPLTNERQMTKRTLPMLLSRVCCCSLGRLSHYATGAASSLRLRDRTMVNKGAYNHNYVYITIAVESPRSVLAYKLEIRPVITSAKWLCKITLPRHDNIGKYWHAEKPHRSRVTGHC